MKRIIAFLLALVLSVGCTFGLTVLANETEPEASVSNAKTPEIISQNVMYGGDFSLMFAVKAASVSGDTVTLSVYGEEPTEGSEALWSKTINASSTTTDVKGIASYVFTTPGVAAKDMDKNFYIVAESAGVKSDVKKYSVAEYLYERLYDDQVAFGTSALEIAQTKLYLSALEVGKNAQNLLFNYDSDPTNDRTTFVTDLCYVTIYPKSGIKGTINGGTSALLVNKGDKISVGSETISYNGKSYIAQEFAVKSISGSDVTSSTLAGNEIVANSHLIIEPTRFFSLDSEPAPETFESMTSVDTSIYSSKNVTSMELVNAGGNTRLKYSFANNSSNHYAYFKIPYASSDAKMVVWEADVDFDNIVKSGQEPGTTVGNAVYITIGAITFTINVNTTGISCYDSPQNWYATISSDVNHKAHIRIEYFETTNASGEAIYDTNFYVDGNLMKPSGAKLYKTVAAAPTKTVDATTTVEVCSASDISGEYYFDNVKFFKTFEPEELFLDEYYTFDGEATVDANKIFASPTSALSIVENDGGSAMKVSLGTSAQERVTFLPIVKEDNANKVVFEYTFTDNFSTADAKASTVLYIYAGSELVYDFRFNNGTLLTAESNTVSWGLNFNLGKTYTLRFEIWMNGTNLEIDLWCNGQKVARPSGYGTGYKTVSGTKVPLNLTVNRSEDLISKISKIEWLDATSSKSGYFTLDNVRFSKINTSN